jgi:LPXTG-motif cell wall-anchored protein
MYVWSESATWRVLAVVLAVTLVGFFGATAQAKDHHDQGCGCPKPAPPAACCPAPVIEPATVQSNCCPIPEVQPKPCAPIGCCGVPEDQSELTKAEKDALHARHEAVEACKKRQKAIAKAKHELAEETAKQQERINRANDHFNHELSEFQNINANYEAQLGGPSEAVTAEATPEPLPQPEIVQPTPEPAPAPEISQVTPAPEPQTTTETAVLVVEQPAPAQLPKTASPMSLIGLIGLASMSAGYLTRRFRR